MVHLIPHDRPIARLMAVLGLTVLVGGAAAQEARIPAFPGAEGFGAFASGGRGGQVLLVTNLDDYDEGEPRIPGTLRAAVETEGPRTVVFRVSGYVELKRMLEIREPHLTIAGQTAPGDGVSLRNYGVDVAADNVIIRYLRVRPGDTSEEELDAINIRSSDVIVDHCSASWATDETVSIIGDATNVTVQWCFIVESLNESVHSKGEHGYGSLISSSGDVSVHHNLYAFHKSRNPRPRHTLLDFRNNVIYGWGDQAGYNEDDRTRMNYVGNYLLPLAYSDNADRAFSVRGPESRLSVEDNVLRLPDGTLRRDWELIEPPRGVPDSATARVVGAPRPFPTPSVTTHDATDVLEAILSKAGATRPRRDAVDLRVAGLVRDRAGKIIDSQEEVGGWPMLEGATPVVDRDRDGMDDRWEERFGLRPDDPADHAADLDGDGYTNLEEYLNETDPTEEYGWLESARIRPESGTIFTDAPLVATIAPSESGVPVVYTTDGREPTSSSPRYTAPLRLFGDAHVRARAVVPGRPTTAAFAEYHRVEWQRSAASPPQHAIPGLRFAVYEAGDWDEGVVLDELAPVREGTVEVLDFSVRPPGGRNAVAFDGWLEVEQDGIYKFFLVDDERSELRLNGRVVAQGRPPAASPARTALRSGFHRFHLRSLHEEPRSSSLDWSGPGFERRPLSENFYVDPTNGHPKE